MKYSLGVILVEVVVNEEFTNRLHVFRDRLDAGIKLGVWLKELGVSTDRVFAIPAGGVPVGFEVAKALGTKLDVLIVRKVSIPWNREAGFGAVAPNGTYFYDEVLATYLGLTINEVQQAINEQVIEVRRRLNIFRCGEDYGSLDGLRVIIVDDGIAAGFTMRAGIRFLRSLRPKEVIVAVPTCHVESILKLAKEESIDRIYCFNSRSGPIYAVADAYIEWHDLTDKEVLNILRKAKELGILAYEAKCMG